jgi:hypothetical protein
MLMSSAQLKYKSFYVKPEQTSWINK